MGRGVGGAALLPPPSFARVGRRRAESAGGCSCVAFWEEQGCQDGLQQFSGTGAHQGKGLGPRLIESRRLLWLIPGLLVFLGGGTKFRMVAGAALSFNYITRLEELGELNQIGSSQ